jgi:transcriptional regulator with GAF, ATPase, and Fis domain
MKKAESSKSIKVKVSPKVTPGSALSQLTEKVAFYESQRQILLDLSDDITNVREKNDLITLFSFRIKGLFYFTHAIVTLIDDTQQTYKPFLLDPAASPIRDHAEYNLLVKTAFNLNEPFIRKVLQADAPVSFLLADVMNNPGSPPFLRVNYEGGVREILMTPLKSKMQTMGFLHVYSDRTDSFTEEFRSIIKGIAPQISSAVSNIIKNEDIRNKERVNEVLLSLSNDMVTVRDRNDLLKVINFGLSKLINFTHSVMTVLDETGETYSAYLTDPESRPKDFHKYTEAITAPNPIADGIYDVAAVSDKPVVFRMKELNIEQAPLWFKLNFNAGAREMLIKVLPGHNQHQHSLILFADNENTFDEHAINIIERISSQLSTAASNIAANEEILNKEREKSFLLDFSSDIAGVRSKEDLALAVQTSLKKLNPLRGYIIRKINDDQQTMSTYIHDGSITIPDDQELQEILASRFPVNDGLQNRVLECTVPLLFNIDAEIRRGITSRYLEFWKKIGFKTMVGIALRSGENKLGILWLNIEEINLPLLQGICAQISVAMANIIANEDLVKKQREQSLLLEFNNAVAGVRTKKDLEQAIFTVLQKMLNTKLAMIRIIDDDHIHLTPYMFDRTLFEKDVTNFDELAATKIDIHEEMTARVLGRAEAVIFNVEQELIQGNESPYIQLWKKIGFKNAYGAALRVGNMDVGTLWLLTDDVNKVLLKGICAQISIAIANILANEKLLSYKRMLEVENDLLKEQIQTIYNFNEIVGNGAEMQKVYHLMTLVAESNATVLLLGETGTGKELIARAIHNASPRKDKLMVKVNCAALPANLIESELFGHEKGAFTGAVERRIGKFELANNSTLFLDEIGEMPLESQVKLLRVLQEKELERVGGKNTIKVDVRIIAATNRNLEAEVSAGRFRSDLYYRLNVFPIHLPPLRNRQEDISPLAHFFVERYRKNAGKKVTSISPKVMQELKSYLWPGNVRELEHLIERSVLLATETVLQEVHLPRKTTEGQQEDIPAVAKTLEEMERSFIIATIRRCGGKLAGPGGAAAYLDIPATTLHSKIKKLGISKSEYFTK